MATLSTPKLYAALILKLFFKKKSSFCVFTHSILGSCFILLKLIQSSDFIFKADSESGVFFSPQDEQSS